MAHRLIKQIGHAMWNGPFYIGKISQPASVGDVLLKVLETLWRAIISIALVALGGLFAALVWMLWGDRLFPPLKDQIVATAEFAWNEGQESDCTSEQPVKVTFENTSDKSIEYMQFYVEVFLEGHSTPSGDLGLLSTDIIIPPNHKAQNCFAFPEIYISGDEETYVATDPDTWVLSDVDPADYTFKATISYARALD